MSKLDALESAKREAQTAIVLLQDAVDSIGPDNAWTMAVQMERAAIHATEAAVRLRGIRRETE